MEVGYSWNLKNALSYHSEVIGMLFMANSFKCAVREKLAISVYAITVQN